LQSVPQQQQDPKVIERQIQQLFSELVSIWRDSDIKKNEAVRRLAARMEEYYLQMEQPQQIAQISSQISQRLKAAGLEKTAHHVADFLDEKYKLDYSTRSSTHPINGMILPNNVLEQYHALNPLDFSHDTKMAIVETIKQKQDWRYQEGEREQHLAKAVIEAAAAQGQAMNYDEDTFTNSKGKPYTSVHSDKPNRNYTGPVHEAFADYAAAVNRYNNAVKSMLEDFNQWGKFETKQEKQMERNLTRAIMFETEFFETWTQVHSPFKDLKFGTSTRNWWNILIRFLEHGKHAAAVMQPIASHLDPELKRPFTREQVGDEVYLKEQLLEKYGENRDFCNYIKDFFINHPDKLYDKDEDLLSIRKEYIGKLIAKYASNKDFFEYACAFREKEMDPVVATRRIQAKDILSELA
jgi:hypothetical protein